MADGNNDVATIKVMFSEFKEDLDPVTDYGKLIVILYLHVG